LCAYCTCLNKQEFQDTFDNGDKWICDGCNKKKTPTTNKRAQSNKTIRTPPPLTNNNVPTPTRAPTNPSTSPVKLITQPTPIQMDIAGNQHVHQLSPRTLFEKTLQTSTTSNIENDDTANMNSVISVLMSKLDTVLENQRMANENFLKLQNQLLESERERCLLAAKVEALSAELLEKDSELVEMRTQTASFRFELNEMKADSNQMKQRTLKNHLEIAGVPIMQNENLTDIFAKICMEIGITSDPTPGIVEIYRLKTKQRTNGMPPVIIAKVVSDLMDDIILYKKGKSIESKIFGETCRENRFIYINEQLIKEYRYLLKRAKDLRRAKKVAYAWVKYGCIFVKKEEGGTSTRILREEDLNEFDI
jgi:hypothetical protein